MTITALHLHERATKKVLIIDDEVDLCILLKQFLEKKDYKVLVAHTLTEGAKQIASFMPDALILDNNLPDGMGWDAAQSFRQQYPDMKITLISAYRSAREYQQLFDDSVYVLEKPVSLSEIEKHI